jgi:spore coat protein U-like protein
MRKTVFLLASLFVMVLATQQMKAQSGASASTSATAKATVVTVLSIEKNADLNFGSFAPSATDGTISVELDGTRSVTGGITVLNQIGAQKAAFTVNGTPNESYYVKLPTDDGNTISLEGPQGTDPLIITSLVHDGDGTLDGNGQDLFSVGGTLSVKANQPAGEYTGTFDVIVAYN